MLDNKHPYISIVIPTLNEGKNIGKAISGVKSALKNYRYEILVVDKHSTDNTISVSKAMGAHIIYENKGKGFALIRGFTEAKGKIIISMDADLSHRPKELKLLIAAIEAGYDICMGSRFLIGGGSDDMPLFRKLGNKVFVLLVNIIYRANYTDLCYGYRSMNRDAFKKVHLTSKGFGIETEISIKAKKAGLKIIEIPSYEKKRTYGVGKLRSFSDGYAILKTIFENIR